MVEKSKWADLKTRTISAVVMIVGLIFAMEIHPDGFLVLLLLIYPLLLKEWFGLILGRPKPIIFGVIGVVYITSAILGIGLAHIIYRSFDEFTGIYYIIALVAAVDIGGYLTGKLFGKHKFFPRISPNKTWEGVIGSIFCASLLCVVHDLILKPELAQESLISSVIMTATIPAILAIAGDLFESYMKRRAGVKDSGSLIPGHGGLLDRVDGLLPVAIYFGTFFLIFLLTFSDA